MNKLSKKSCIPVLPKINKSPIDKQSILPSILSSNVNITQSNQIVNTYLLANNSNNKVNSKNNYIKLEPISNKIFKNKYDCNDAEEYITQLKSIHDIYNFEEANKKIEIIRKILLKQNIFFIKAPWDSVWDNELYLQDYTHEYIARRYIDILYTSYDKKFIDKSYVNKKYSKKLLCTLYVDKLVSFLSVSDYLFCFSKIYGILQINCNFINEFEKKIVLDCFNEFFPNRFSYNPVSDSILINLKKNNFK
jgi:hypothetical protein